MLIWHIVFIAALFIVTLKKFALHYCTLILGLPPNSILKSAKLFVCIVFVSQVYIGTKVLFFYRNPICSY